MKAGPKRPKATTEPKQKVESRKQKGGVKRPKATTKLKQKVESRKQKGGTNPSCGSASPGHSGGGQFSAPPLAAQTSEREVVNALDVAALIPHRIVTEHDRLVLTESCGQAQVRRAC